eukprot:213549_1
MSSTKNQGLLIPISKITRSSNYASHPMQIGASKKRRYPEQISSKSRIREDSLVPNIHPPPPKKRKLTHKKPPKRANQKKLKPIAKQKKITTTKPLVEEEEMESESDYEEEEEVEEDDSESSEKSEYVPSDLSNESTETEDLEYLAQIPSDALIRSSSSEDEPEIVSASTPIKPRQFQPNRVSTIMHLSDSESDSDSDLNCSGHISNHPSKSQVIKPQTIISLVSSSDERDDDEEEDSSSSSSSSDTDDDWDEPEENDNLYPEYYDEIEENVFVSRPKWRVSTKEESDYCRCNADRFETCNESDYCLNRRHQIECTEFNCNVGDVCRNRRFQNREWKCVTVQRRERKGFGLFADENIEKNEFIMEYVGEIINENEYKRRMKEEYKGQSRLRMMRMGQDVIDAKQKGSKARFMNHSCSPNCNVVQWTIDKEHVLGIFAIQSIKKDEELTFDYRINHCGSLSKNHQVTKSPQHGSGEVSSIEEDEDDDLTDWTAYHQKQKKTKMNKTDALQRNHALKMPRRRNGLILSAVKPSKEKSKKKKKNAKKNVEAKNASENEENTTHNADVEECDVVKDGSDLICKGLFKFKSSQYNYIMATKNAAKRSKLSYNLGIFKDIKPDEIDNEHTNFNTFELRKYCRNGSDGIPVSIRIANTNQFWWYDQTQRIKIKNGEYKFQAYYTGKGGKYISLRHEDQKYIAVTKNGRLTAGRKGIVFKFELIEVQSCEMEVQVQTKLTQYYPQKDNGNQNTQSENATNMDDDEETSPYAYPVCDESLDDALEQLVIMENDYQSSYPEYNVEDIVQSPTDDAVNSEAE